MQWPGKVRVPRRLRRRRKCAGWCVIVTSIVCSFASWKHSLLFLLLSLDIFLILLFQRLSTHYKCNRWSFTVSHRKRWLHDRSNMNRLLDYEISLHRKLLHGFFFLSLEVFLMRHLLLKVCKTHPHVVQILVPLSHLMLKISIAVLKFGILHAQNVVFRSYHKTLIDQAHWWSLVQLLILNWGWRWLAFLNLWLLLLILSVWKG